MTYDLHIHSALSPCADDDMTPANIAGFAKLNGIELIAVSDHNAADNLPAVQQACDAFGVRLLPAIEVNTEEEIHLLTYFRDVDTALAMSRILYDHLPETPYDPEIWGRQLVMDTDDNILRTVERLLTGAVTLNLYEVTALCRSMGGIAVPAHVDKETTSLLSVLGFAPEDLPFEIYEVKRPEHTLEKLLEQGRLPGGREILTSSDAHTLPDISTHPRTLPEDSFLNSLL